MANAAAQVARLLAATITLFRAGNTPAAERAIEEASYALLDIEDREVGLRAAALGEALATALLSLTTDAKMAANRERKPRFAA